MSDRTPSDDIKDLANTVEDLVDEHSETVDKVFDLVAGGTGDIPLVGEGDDDDGQVLSLDDVERLREVSVQDDKIAVTIEIPKVEKLKVSVYESDKGLTIEYSDEKMVIKDYPGDIDVQDSDASISHGVLTVDIPRDNDTGSSVTVTDGDL